jgi:hypothetical protein
MSAVLLGLVMGVGGMSDVLLYLVIGISDVDGVLLRHLVGLVSMRGVLLRLVMGLGDVDGVLLRLVMGLGRVRRVLLRRMVSVDGVMTGQAAVVVGVMSVGVMLAHATPMMAGGDLVPIGTHEAASLFREGRRLAPRSQELGRRDRWIIRLSHDTARAITQVGRLLLGRGQTRVK